jgi:hypothetical protein
MKEPGRDTAFEHALARLRLWLVPTGTIAGAWVETVVFSAAAILIGRYLSPDDPLFVQTQFPWPWFAPVLLALRYGVIPGIASSALLLAGWTMFQPDPATAEIPKLYFLGGLLLVMVSGEYSSLWRTRIRRLTEVNGYLEERIERITKRLYLLRLSHERLEQDVLSRPSTLRDAVGALRQRVSARAGEGPLPGAQDLLGFLAQYCQLEVAALYAAELTSGKSGVNYRRIAAIGDPPELARDDPLMEFARQRRRLAHIQTSELDKAHPTVHLAIAPIESGDGRHLGMLVITRMPFFAMNDEMLQTIVVLLSAYADGITAAEQVLPLMAQLPGLPIEFAEEYVKLARMYREFGIASHIVVLTCFGHPERADILDQLKRERRLPDITWVVDNLVECSFLITLMPLAGSAAVDGYLLRIENSLRESRGGGFRDLGVYPHVLPFSRRDPLAEVRRLLMEQGAPGA